MQKGIKKSIQSLYKIDARKRHAKSMENYTKMHPKWEPKSVQNSKNTKKNGIRKLTPKFDAQNGQTETGTRQRGGPHAAGRAEFSQYA